MKLKATILLITLLTMACNNSENKNTDNEPTIANDNMVYIKGGTFQMGSNEDEDEKPIHSVTINSFYMSKYEVTQKQWQDIMGTTISEQRDKTDKNLLLYGEGDNYPMYYVNWNDIQEFIKRLNTKTGKKYRLPTEAEWEYAAQGGQNYKYAGSDEIEKVAWYNSNSENKTHLVGQKLANGYGLYDMTGNVNECCQDIWHKNYSGAPTNGSAWISDGDPTYRVIRGCSWYFASLPSRIANRGRIIPTFRNALSGFRLVLS